MIILEIINKSSIIKMTEKTNVDNSENSEEEERVNSLLDT